jgi:16S rRNA (cytidine1402-2'-O)-methyltransferase
MNSKLANLYLVATPIGNLNDLSFRALSVLKEVDLILAEDTRETKKLLRYYRINTPLLSFHQHTQLKKINYILELLKQGKSLALVSEAGTPGLSDPGGKLVEVVVEELKEKVKIIPIPGPSALTAAVSVSGFSMDKFLFLGFLPKKKKREKFLKEILESKYPVIFYESPFRIIKTLKELEQKAKELKIEPKVVVCRELTKKFESIYRGKIEKVVKEIEKDKIKGEFVIIVRKK